jgi:hypothetical protein
MKQLIISVIAIDDKSHLNVFMLEPSIPGGASAQTERGCKIFGLSVSFGASVEIL